MTQPPVQLPQPLSRGHRTTARRGFTLIEVLAALVLVAIVLPVAMRGVTLSMQAAARSRQLTEAGQLAASKLAELTVLKDVTLFSSSGAFPDFPEYRWETTSAQRDNGLYEVNARVIWTAQGLEQWVTLTTLIYPAAATSSSTSGAASGGTTGATP
ncbi:MAG TPA: type II secretion system protein [Tepidisphaeraceae bacterium]|jgi:prepilin-type N-terminal cleavage/methylation domain-containing protein|nr:type II secretion system protein [Tepidisphaeraceae bacterium]